MSQESRLLSTFLFFYFQNDYKILVYLKFLIFDRSNFACIASRSFNYPAEIWQIFQGCLFATESFESLDPEPLLLFAPDLRKRAVCNIIIFYNRMYNNSNAEQRIKQNKKSNIFNIAEQICQQIQGKNQALEIINAYRKVEDIRVPNNSNNLPKKTKQSKIENKKPVSQYANKVKQTLRQLNANKKKQLQTNKQSVSKSISNQIKTKLGSSQRHLIQSGLKRVFKIFDKKYDQYLKQGFKKIYKIGTSLGQEIQEKIRLWKLARLFSGWQYETMLTKIQKQRIKNDQIQKEKRNIKLAQCFHQFLIYKNVFKSWKQQIRKTIKKRQLQLQEELKRQEEYARLEQQQKKIQKQKENKKQSKKQIQPNIQLQNKLKGFLNGLKEQISNKNRINTIKQNTEQQQSGTKSETNQMNANQNQNIDERVENEQQNQNNNQNQSANQDRNTQKGPMTNEDLQKRRKQLEKKARQRKQALEKLKKQREQKRKQQEQQKTAIQKQIEQQQKRIKQEQYKKFVKQRKQEQQWKIRQKELQKQAIQFDRLRIMRFYGWAYWTKLKSLNRQNVQNIQSILQKIFMKRRLNQFIENVIQKGQQKLKQQQQKVQKWYKRKLLKKSVQKLKQSKNQELQLKQQLVIRHQVYTLKIYLKQWLRTRNSIQLQNYQWERPRIKKAEALYHLTLAKKGFQLLKINRDQEIQNRNVEQHKAKIKEKVHQIVEQKPTINYDDFL